MDYTAILNQLADELGFGKLDETRKTELIAKMGEALLKRILLETFDRLGESGTKEYDELIDRNGSQEEITAFLKRRIPDYEDMIVKVVAEFKEQMKQEFV
ncbi:MAG: hypothetical protein KBC83_02825 [Candidatus Moranbacteria bacterium]|jgi:hypothetical protein|nr:hypothetical protein [Candidatus Moranbacteria bacterium]MBP9801572.1 hypothetical protein [Candidatus Moranbacteria bacterium]